MLTRDLLDQLVLDAVRVLVLVDQHVLPAQTVVGQDVGKALEELRGAHQQVAEVERVGVREQALVGGVDLGGPLGLEVHGPVEGLGRRDAGVLPLIDAPRHAAGIVDLRVEAVPPQRLLHDAQAVRLVVDGEAAREAQVPDVAPQDADAGGVKGGEQDALGARPEQLLHALAHLSGGLVREGDGQDALGRDPAGADQMGDPVGEDARLAASRPCQHQQRALGGLDGPALLGVQPLQYGRCRRLLHAGAHLAEDHFSTGRGIPILPNAAAFGRSGLSRLSIRR